MIIDPWTNILCVHRYRPVVMPRLWGHTNYTVFVGVLLLRCVSKLDGRPCIYKVAVEAAEIAPGQFACDTAHTLHRLPATLEYRGNTSRLMVRVIQKDRDKALEKFRFATGQHQTGEAPRARKVYNTWELVDPRAAPAIVELRAK